MSRARGCERRRRAGPQAHEKAGIRGYRLRAACARLTGVVLWRRRVVDAEAAGVTSWIADVAGAISLAGLLRLSAWLWSGGRGVRVQSAHPSEDGLTVAPQGEPGHPLQLAPCSDHPHDKRAANGRCVGCIAAKHNRLHAEKAM